MSHHRALSSLKKRKYLKALCYFSLALSSVDLNGVNFLVTSSADDNSVGTLRNAINQANISPSPINIIFNTAGPINLTDSLPPLGAMQAPLNITMSTGINNVTIAGSGKYSGLFVLPQTTFTLDDSGGGSLTMSSTASVGGDGGFPGGGGGLGAGGGLFVQGTATVSGLALTNCSAQGGNGANLALNASQTNTTASGGGGGGGMSGASGGSSKGSGGGGGGVFGTNGTGGQGADTAEGGGGGGGGGLFFSGGNSSHTSGGGGASDAANGGNSSGGLSPKGGDGANGALAGNPGGPGGAAHDEAGDPATDGTGTGGGGGGGGAIQITLDSPFKTGGAAGNSGISPNGGGVPASGNTKNTCGGGGGAGFAGGGGGGVGGVAAGAVVGNGGGGGGGFGGEGGGGGTTSTTNLAAGGNGGFGGGGGGSGGSNQSVPPPIGIGGEGGFGGGGGGSCTQDGSFAGSIFGGGQGGNGQGNTKPMQQHGGGSGGGGAALGGAIFVDQGATLNLKLNSISGSSVTAGSAGNAAYDSSTNGQALGIDIFLGSTGTINFTHSTTLTLHNSIPSDAVFGGGAGGLEMSGSGTLILPAGNSYAGTTFFNGGTVVITADTALGLSQNPMSFNSGTLFMNNQVVSSRSITLAGTGTLSMNAPTTFTFSGVISGSGPIQITGNAGTMQFLGANTYTGGTNIFNNRILQISSPSSIGSGSLALGNGGTGGTLQLLQGFSGSTIPNSFTVNAGGGTISSNLPSGGSVVFSGPVTNNGSTVLNPINASSMTFSGPITGAGSVTVNGAGNVIFTNVDTYAGTTTINSGTLTVLGTLQPSPITVSAAGTLKGTGTVQDANIFGTIAPGTSIGTIHGVNFSFFPSSTYALEISDTTSDLIAATGTVTINGGRLQLFPLGFTTPDVSSYTIITAGTVNAPTPFTLINPLTRYNFTVLYNPTSVVLSLAGPPTPFSNLVFSGNAAQVAKCFDVIALMDLPDLAEVIHILDLETPAQIASDLNQMQPANFNNIAFAEENVAERIRQIYTNHFFEQRVVGCQANPHWRLWAAPFAEHVRQHGKSNLPGYRETFGDFSAALDYLLKKQWMFTGGFSYASTDMHIPNARTRAEFETYAGTLGTAWTDSKWFADAQLSYLYSTINAKREMEFQIAHFALNSAVKRTARHHENSNQVLSHIGFGYDFKIKPSSTGSVNVHPFTTLSVKTTSPHTYNIYPFINIDYLYLPQHGYSEHGAQSLDLKVKSKRYDLLRPEGGIGFGYNGCFEKIQTLFDISVSYIHEFRFLGKKTTSSFKPSSCEFTVTGLKPENNLVSPEARLRLTMPGTGISLTLGYHGEFGEHFIMNAGEAEFRAAF